MPDLFLILALIIASILFGVIIFLSSQWFELAVLIVILTPLASAAFYENIPGSDYLENANVGTYLRLGLLFVMGITGIIKYIQCWPLHKGKIPLHIFLLICFIIFAIFSTIYSIDKNFTFVRATSFLSLGFFLLGFDAWLREKKQYDKIINVLYVFILLNVIAILLLVILLPSRAWWWGEDNRFMGIWDHPNAMGALCMLSYFILFIKLTQTKKNIWKIFIVLIIIMMIIFHYFTGSRTSLFASGAGIIIWFLFHKKVVKTLLFAFTLNTLIFIVIQIQPPEFLRQPGTGITDLSGRQEFWQGAMILINEKPVLGYGYGVDGKVWQDARFYNPQFSLWKGSAKTSLHNGYISVAIGVGLILFLLWCVILVIPLFYSFKLANGYYKSFFLAVLTVILLSNFTESAIQNGNSLDSIIFWVTWIMAGKAVKTELKTSKTGLAPINS